MRRLMLVLAIVIGATLALRAQPETARPQTARTRAAPTRKVPAPAAAGRDDTKPFEVVEVGIPELQAALTSGRVTSRELVLLYLARIAYHEDAVNATMAVSRTALAEAGQLDRERRAGKVRGPLHGIPIALKDNIHTTNLPTTGGALAFDGFTPPYEATVTTLLREAGAIVIAKTVMTELANWSRAARRRCRRTTAPLPASA